MAKMLTGCSGANSGAEPTTVADRNQPDIAAIIAEHRDALMRPGVAAVGESLCDGMPCIRIYLEKADPELERSLPKEIEGVPVVTEVSGVFRAR